MDKTTMNFRDNVWHYLEKKGWDQADLAAHAELSTSGVRKLMSGASVSSAGREKIAAAFGVPLAILLAAPGATLIRVNLEEKTVGDMTGGELFALLKSGPSMDPNVQELLTLIPTLPTGVLPGLLNTVRMLAAKAASDQSQVRTKRSSK